MTSEKQLTVRQNEYALAARPTDSRPTLCTEDNTDIILDAIRDGLSYKDAATLAGVTDTTIYNWQRYARAALTKADQGKPLTYNDQLYLNFFNKLQTAKVEQKLDALQKIKRAGTDPKHWHANAWLLERKYPDEFGRRNRVDVYNWRKDAKKHDIDMDAILSNVVDQLENRLLEGAEDATFTDK